MTSSAGYIESTITTTTVYNKVEVTNLASKEKNDEYKDGRILYKMDKYGSLTNGRKRLETFFRTREWVCDAVKLSVSSQ